MPLNVYPFLKQQVFCDDKLETHSYTKKHIHVTETLDFRALYEHFTWQCLVLKIKHEVKISFTPKFLRKFYNSIWDLSY